MTGCRYCEVISASLNPNATTQIRAGGFKTYRPCIALKRFRFLYGVRIHTTTTTNLRVFATAISRLIERLIRIYETCNIFNRIVNLTSFYCVRRKNNNVFYRLYYLIKIIEGFILFIFNW